MRLSSVLAVAFALAGCSSDDGSGATPRGGNIEGCTPDYGCEPEPPATTLDPYQDCVNRVNQFRACACMTPLERWTEAEACADQQVAYDRANDDPHGAFGAGICSPRGNAQNECLGGNVNGCIQRMFDEGPPPQEPCEGSCYQMHGHFINMTSDRYERVACGFDGDWAVQNFD